MNEFIYQIGGILNTNLHQMYQNRVPVGSLNDPQKSNQKTIPKFIIENNVIVYEKYDRNGNLVSRIPWSPNTIDVKV
jgi:hypothetical protein